MCIIIKIKKIKMMLTSLILFLAVATKSKYWPGVFIKGFNSDISFHQT